MDHAVQTARVAPNVTMNARSLLKLRPQNQTVMMAHHANISRVAVVVHSKNIIVSE